jgi:tetratricopeptide (TPR) repeat protein
MMPTSTTNKHLKQDVIEDTLLIGISLTYILQISKQLEQNDTMNDFVQKIIKPTTQQRNESYVQYLARENPTKIKHKADYFISYVWSYKIQNELLSALQYTLFCDNDNHQDDIYVWLDAFCINQHHHQPNQQLVILSNNTLLEIIKSINSMVIVFCNWENPEYTKRSWCIFETYLAEKSQIDHVILAMSENEQNNLIQAMIHNKIDYPFLETYFSVMVDVETAKAKEPSDEQAILQLITEFGIAEVNSVVLDHLKQWMVQVGEIALANNSIVQEHSIEAGNICMAQYAIYSVLGEYNTALQWVEKALTSYLQVFQGNCDHEEIASAWNGKMSCLHQLGHLDEAFIANDQVLAIRNKILGPDHPNTLTSLSWKAGILQSQGKLQEALILRNEVLESRKRVLGNEHNDTVAAMTHKALILKEMKQFDDALKIFEEIMTISERILSQNHPTFAARLENKALCLQEMGRPAEALPLYDKTLQIWRKVYGDFHPEVAICLTNKAKCLRALKQYSKALDLIEEALVINRETYGNEHFVIADNLASKALNLQNVGKLQESYQIGKQALEMFESTLGVNHPRTINARSVFLLG